jgi:cobalamin synthase
MADSTAAPIPPSPDPTVASDRRTVNLIWETTQMKIALSVIWAALVAGVLLALFGRWLGMPDVQLAAVVFLFGVANLVTGFYFGRTNHQRTGGIRGDQGGAR